MSLRPSRQALAHVIEPGRVGQRVGAEFLGDALLVVVEQGAVQAVALPLFQAYLVPFEIASLMLLAAIVGAVVLAKRRI